MTPNITTPAPENMRGIFFMVFSMAIFTVEDALIKILSRGMPLGQILIVIALGGTLVLGLRARAQGVRLFDRALLHPMVITRGCAELVGTTFFVASLALAPLSIVGAIIQVSPLIVTLGGALFLGEKVGMRRWSAIFIGMIGMMLILRPGGDAFTFGAFCALIGTIGLSVRDLTTRRIPQSIPTTALATWGFVAVLPAGLILLMFDANIVWPTALDSTYLLGCIVLGAFGYVAITTAMRIGEVSAVAPFRYSRLIFALILGAVLFGERPEALTLLGAAIVVASGIYTLWREARLR